MHKEMTENNSFLCAVPNEIKFKIFSYLKTSDIILVCKAYPILKNIMYDRTVLKSNSLCFCKSFYIYVDDLSNYFSNGAAVLCNITYLNIAGLYWIPVANLIKCIKKLPKLKHLIAIGTKLRTSMLLNFELPKLQSIAVTEKISNCLKYMELLHTNDIKHCVIQIERNDAFMPYLLCTCTSLLQVVQQFPNSGQFTMDFNGEVVITIKDILPSVKQIISNDIEQQCIDEYLNLLNDYPFGIREIRSLFSKRCNFKNIVPEELNLCHKRGITDVEFEQFKNYTQQILISDSTKTLKKLALEFCFCEGADYSPVAKRSKKGVDIDDENANSSTFQKVILNCSSLQELELWTCNIHTHSLNQTSLNYISNLKQLKKLTLIGVPLNISRNLLNEIIKNCDNLEYLNIKSTKSNAALNTSMYLSLPYATSLKDFRYEHSCTSLDRLFESLNKIENSQLRRLYFKFDSIEKFSIKPFEDFLKNHPNLLFVLLQIKSVPKYVHTSIRKSMKEYIKNPQQVFYSTADDPPMSVIPLVHRLELVEIQTKVSVFNFFDGYNIFI